MISDGVLGSSTPVRVCLFKSRQSESSLERYPLKAIRTFFTVQQRILPLEVISHSMEHIFCCVIFLVGFPRRQKRKKQRKTRNGN